MNRDWFNTQKPMRETDRLRAHGRIEPMHPDRRAPAGLLILAVALAGLTLLALSA